MGSCLKCAFNDVCALYRLLTMVQEAEGSSEEVKKEATEKLAKYCPLYTEEEQSSIQGMIR